MIAWLQVVSAVAASTPAATAAPLASHRAGPLSAGSQAGWPVAACVTARDAAPGRPAGAGAAPRAPLPAHSSMTSSVAQATSAAAISGECRRHQVHAKGDVADRQPGEDVGDHRPQRIAGFVGHAQRVGGRDQFAGVLEGDRGSEGRDIQRGGREERHADRGGQEQARRGPWRDGFGGRCPLAGRRSLAGAFPGGDSRARGGAFRRRCPGRGSALLRTHEGLSIVGVMWSWRRPRWRRRRASVFSPRPSAPAGRRPPGLRCAVP